jgi:amino acid transporter
VQTEIVDYNPDDIKLRKHITLPVTVGIIIGNVIGSGIFISPVNVVDSVGSVGAALLIWLTVGIYCLVQALCYAELGTVIPKAGGDYAYIYYILGPLPAFMCVWMHVAMICTSSTAAIGRTAAPYLLKPLGADCNPSLVTMMAMWIIGELPQSPHYHVPHRSITTLS